MNLFVLLAFLQSPVLAETQKSTLVSVKVVHGEVVTQFTIDAATSTLKINNARLGERMRKIDFDDLNFLIEMAQKLPKTNPLPKECHRASMQVTIAEKNKQTAQGASCFGMRSITSKAYQDFANLLVLAI